MRGLPKCAVSQRAPRFAHLSRASFIATWSIGPSGRTSNRTFWSGSRPTLCHRKQRRSVIDQMPCPHDRAESFERAPRVLPSFQPKGIAGSTKATFAGDHAHFIAVWRRLERDRRGNQPGLRVGAVTTKGTILPYGTTQAAIKFTAGKVEASRDFIRDGGCRGNIFIFGDPPRGNKSFARSVFTRGQFMSVLPRRQRDRTLAWIGP
jgi:hypothetical protein